MVYARQIAHPLIKNSSSEKILDVEDFPTYNFLRGSAKAPDSGRENDRNLLNYTDSTSTFKSCDTVEKDYEKMFRRTLDQEIPQHEYTTLEETHKKGKRMRSVSYFARISTFIDRFVPINNVVVSYFLQSE